jgi:serine/threonine protein kinase
MIFKKGINPTTLILESKASTFAGTLLYIPPERFNDDQTSYDDRTDIWSLGITLIEIAYGDIPYDIKEFDPTNQPFQILNIIKNVDADQIMRQCFSENYSIVLRSFIRECLEELSSRPRYSELMERMLYKSLEFKNGKEYIMNWFIEIYLVIR